MSKVLAPPARSLLLEHTDWRTYTRLLRVFANRLLRATYL